jgi:hypothetical protein
MSKKKKKIIRGLGDMLKAIAEGVADSQTGNKNKRKSQKKRDCGGC